MSGSRLPLVAARTHPPRQRLHKYWSRKPHNVIHAFVEAILDEPGVVVDPFVGSGVTASEAAALGHQVHACDVNPTSVLLAETTVRPPDARPFTAAMTDLLDDLEAEVGDSWRCPDSGRTVRYVVHEVRTRCSACGIEQSASQVVGSGRARRCSACDAPVRLNLETMVGTDVVGVSWIGGTGLNTDPAVIRRQADASEAVEHDLHDDPLALHFQENRRILAFAGMKPADLFTKRVLWTLLRFRTGVQQLEDPAQRRAGLLLLTASAAQCSRLTAFRNNLSTGGPAWSVPGFWVPPIHLETNPLVHLRARVRRFQSGLADAARSIGDRGTDAEIAECDASSFLRGLAHRKVRADLVILDPPYGDSVPFVEFSAFWNALLSRNVDARVDLSVSDRETKADAWGAYDEGIGEVISAAADLLAPGGRVLVAFNNHDMRAWRALLEAAQAASLRCLDAVYQFPAVISAKAAFHPKGSYVGDVWALFGRAEQGWSPTTDLNVVVEALGACAAFRGGVCARNLVLRTMAMTWLREDIQAAMVSEWESIENALFEPIDDHLLRWKRPVVSDVPAMPDLVLREAREALADGPMEWKELYIRVASACTAYGVPDPGEVRSLFNEDLVVTGSRVMSIASARGPQLDLFSTDHLDVE